MREKPIWATHNVLPTLHVDVTTWARIPAVVRPMKFQIRREETMNQFHKKCTFIEVTLHSFAMRIPVYCCHNLRCPRVTPLLYMRLQRWRSCLVP